MDEDKSNKRKTKGRVFEDIRKSTVHTNPRPKTSRPIGSNESNEGESIRDELSCDMHLEIKEKLIALEANVLDLNLNCFIERINMVENIAPITDPSFYNKEESNMAIIKEIAKVFVSTKINLEIIRARYAPPSINIFDYGSIKCLECNKELGETDELVDKTFCPHCRQEFFPIIIK